MAPGTRRAANRGGYAEHDDFEGLPVRQWRQEWTTIAPPEKQEQHDRNDIWAHELIHGMPKDSNLLPTHTQELLRAARSGRLYDIPAPPEDEEVDSETVLPDKAEKKNESDDAAKKFSIKTWKQIPRNVEAPTTSYLASRRKGTVTIASKTVPDRLGGPTVTRATVKRLDAAGNSYTEEITLAEGQRVDGEIISTRVESVAAINGSAGANVTPVVRARPKPPKRKPKGGPGRGKKKVKMAAPGAEQPVGAAPADGAEPKPEGENGIQKEGEAHQDSEMADGDDHDNDDEEEDESDEGEDEEKGDKQEAADSQPRDAAVPSESRDKEMTDVAAVDTSVLDNADIEMKDGEATPDSKPLPPNPLTLAPPAASLASGSPKVEGSPLKNVLISSPTKENAPILTEPPLDAMPPIPKAPVEDSVVAEPPSTIVGDEPEKAVDRDVPPPLGESVSTDEALLPPPPEQVGNIASPKQSPKASPKPESFQDQQSQDNGQAKEEAQAGEELVPQKPVLPHLAESNLTEDTIRPDDSASAGRPATASGPSSEVAVSVAEPTTEPTTEATAETIAEPTAEPTIEPAVEPTTEPTIEPTTEPTTEPTADPVLEPATEVIAETATEPTKEQAVGVALERAPSSEVVAEATRGETSAEPSTAEDVKIESPVTKEPKEDSAMEPSTTIVAETHAESGAPTTEPRSAQGDGPDLLGGLMGELDKDASAGAPEGQGATEGQTELSKDNEAVDADQKTT